ncbi:MAG: HesA/MoeB/ThiF family protein [Thermodesulfobacteriota bacterium]
MSPEKSAAACPNADIPREIQTRYTRNLEAFTPEDLRKLKKSSVIILGAGGLGGNILEILARTGVGHITVVDGDNFEASNLNRQLLCTEKNLGENKARAAVERIRLINSETKVNALPVFLDDNSSATKILYKHDLVIDALGGINSKKILLKTAGNANKPLVTGFVAGWTGLASTVLPGETGPLSFWEGEEQDGAETRLGCIAPVTTLIASVQSAETLRFLSGSPPRLSGGILCVDMGDMTFNFMRIKK